MSYEYKLLFDDSFIAQHLIDVVKTSSACVRAEEGDLYLKDYSLNSSGAYDARLINGSDGSLWLQVNFQSAELYALLKTALNGRNFRCLEDGDEDEEVGLNEAFRV
ncbi:hypothetical protein PS925_02143 [Pseudomonas fluorescens]|uniref:Uncharacterized protein n=1 Tax=Pseudomonas fluorescens TaxID=294 RepID=A0A5E7TM34_PSEFL|nr:hypothetical protein [Pseudomonas fluorescens]VVP99300.1 hypothetical protein PS925_02143 [Pseudomonas fluorescens]